MSSSHVIHTAGTVPWRVRSGGLEVALVHRPAYDDWSWPKGKLDPAERSPVAATRETFEETGYRVRLGVPLAESMYAVDGGSKIVRYWAASITGGNGKLVNEIDDVAWCSPKAARKRLSYERDHDQLEGLVARHEAGTLDTVPLVFVRHALATPRSQWRKADQRRTLNSTGLQQAKALAPVIEAFGVRRLLSSSSERCATTFRWASKRLNVPVRITDRLTEEGFAAKPRAAMRSLDALTDWSRAKGHGSALCTHGPLIGPMLNYLATGADKEVARDLRLTAREGMIKGEAIVMHMRRGGSARRIVAIEHHRP